MALREAIVQSLSCMLSANYEIRKVAEERMKALEVTDEFTNVLLEIILTAEEALEERQMAAVVLKHYVADHWQVVEGHEDDAVPSALKEKIRIILPMGLTSSQQKIRASVAVTLAHIASIDFPQKWANMTHIIKAKLLTYSYEEVDGVASFVDSCTRLLSSEKLELLSKDLYDIFHNIIETEMFNANVQSRVIKTCVYLLLINRNNVNPTLSTTIDMIDRFYLLLCVQLQKPYTDQNDFQLKAVIVRALDQLLHKNSVYVQDSLPALLSTIWEILIKCGNEYRKIIMYANYNADSLYEEDNKIYFEHLVNNIFSFIFTVVDTNIIAHSISSLVPDLIYWIILFQSITPTFEKDWEEDDLCFFNDDCEDLLCNSIRTTLRSLLSAIITNLGDTYPKDSLSYAIEKHIKEAQLAKEQSYVYWWRILESIMFSLGNISSIIKEKHPDWFETITDLLTHWTNYLDTSAPMILQARIVWLGGEYSAQMTVESFAKHVQYISNNLNASHHIIRISALRALSFHCRNMSQKSIHFEIFLNASENIFDRLLADVKVCRLAFGTTVTCIRFIINVSPTCPIKHSSKLIQFIIDKILKNINDFIIVDQCLDIVKDLSSNNFIVNNLYHALLQVFLNILTNPLQVTKNVAEGRIIAFRIVNFLIVYSPPHLVQELVEQGFPVVYRAINAAKEPSVIELGLMCTQNFLAKSTDHIRRLRDDHGKTGVDCVIGLLKYVLSPRETEFTSLEVAKFIIFAIRAIHQTKPNLLDLTIKALVSKIHIGSVMNYEGSLVLVFAYLFYTNIESTSKLLSTIPGPDGGSALRYIFVKWLNRHDFFYGKFEKNLSSVAFAKVMEFALSRNDEKLVAITITNDVVPRPAMDKPQQKNINDTIAATEHEPLFVKIFRLLVEIAVYEIHISENRTSTNGPVLDDILETKTEPENDLEYIYKIDLIEYLVDLLRRFSQTHHYQNVLTFMKEIDNCQLYTLGLIDDDTF